MKKNIEILCCFKGLLMIVVALISCRVIMFNGKRFDNKNEVIQSVKYNIKDLNLIVEYLYANNKDNKNYITIEKKNNAVWNDSIEANGIYDKVFNNNSLRYIELDSTNDKITFCTYVNFQSTYCGFYYSKNDNKCLRNTSNYITNGKWTVHFFQEKSGWYTEKICDNWYYYEEDWDHFNFINYIKDDLKQMKEYNEIYNRFTQYFDD